MYSIHFAYGSTSYRFYFDPWIDPNTSLVVMNDEIRYFVISITCLPWSRECVRPLQLDNWHIKFLYMHFLLNPRLIWMYHLSSRTMTFTLPPPFCVDLRNASTHASEVTCIRKPYLYALIWALIWLKRVAHHQERWCSVILPSHPPSSHRSREWLCVRPWDHLRWKAAFIFSRLTLGST